MAFRRLLEANYLAETRDCWHTLGDVVALLRQEEWKELSEFRIAALQNSSTESRLFPSGFSCLFPPRLILLSWFSGERISAITFAVRREFLWCDNDFCGRNSLRVETCNETEFRQINNFSAAKLLLLLEAAREPLAPRAMPNRWKNISAVNNSWGRWTAGLDSENCNKIYDVINGNSSIIDAFRGQ